LCKNISDHICGIKKSRKIKKIKFHNNRKNKIMIKVCFTLFSFLLAVPVVYAQKSVAEFIKSGIQKENLEDFKGALADYNQAIFLDPQNTEALYYRGFVKTRMQDFANAMTDFDLAIAIDTESVELYYSRGNTNFELKNFTMAIEDYSKAIVLDSTDKELYYNRAIAKYNLGERESACKDLQTAIKKGDGEATKVFNELCKEY
jgi:tetratricopeptide (TPR) repeat protein